VEKHPFRFEDKPFSLTVSLGIAVTEGDATLTAAGLLRQADDKLYQAKRAGRNRVVS
jgi:diguanylate cyclase (GGDEF)-like protein